MMPETVDETFVRFHEVPTCEIETGRGRCDKQAVGCVEWHDGTLWACEGCFRKIIREMKEAIKNPHPDEVLYEYDFRDIPRPPYTGEKMQNG